MKKTKLFALILFNMLLAISCDNNPATTTATITTTAPSNITYTTVDTGGNVTFDGGTAVTARGMCWSTTPNPTIADNTTIETIDNFTTTITGLSENTTYYLRSYAVNSDGVSYGNEGVFTTWKLSNTKWAFLLNYNPSNSNYPGDVDFYDDGTTRWDEPSSPGTYTTYGTWSVQGDTVMYDFLGDPASTSYIFTGTVVGGTTMSGTFTWGTNPDKTFTATIYP